MASVLLHAPQDFHNLCLLARTLNVFGFEECHVFDPYRLVRERYGKSRSRELRVVSAGAFEKIRWLRVENPIELIESHGARAVATVADPKAPPLSTFRFERSDLVVFGSESRGLPSDVLARCRVTVTVPTVGETQSLNLAVAFGIVLFEWKRQTTLP
jgi:tRNA G18 (ribose-2'-O)-methylase SpoU